MSSTRSHIHIPQNLGEIIADAVVGGMGSWKFIIIQTVIVVSWIILNTLGFILFKWDVYPFILLNLLFSTQAAYAAPLILMSSNRQAARDKKRDDLESEEVQSLFDNHLQLIKMNELQLQILHQQNEILDMLKPKSKKQSV